jgi:hypothetical protein
MRDFEDSTLWRISAYERMRLERSSSVFAQLGENTVLPTTLLADLRHLEARREDTDLLEVLGSCMRHRQAALICVQCQELVWPLTVFPTEMLYHSPRDVALVAPADLARLKVLSCDAPGVRPPGHWMRERVGRYEHYRSLKPLLWNAALHGPRNVLLSEIAGSAAYRATASRAELQMVTGALGPAAERLRRESVSLREMAGWPGLSTERASRLLNALYLNSALMVMRTHPAARQDGSLLDRLKRLGRPRH